MARSAYPDNWPLCPNCDKPALDGHITCGALECGEGRARDESAFRRQFLADCRDDRGEPR